MMTGEIHTPPGPKRGWLPGEQLLAFQRDPLGYLSLLAQKYGDIAYLRFGPRQVYLLSHPDFIKSVLVTDQRNFIKSKILQRSKLLLGEGLLTSEGELHLRQRRMIQPVFHHQRIAGYGEIMVDYASRAAARWRSGQALDIHAEMQRLTMGIVAKTLFGVDIEAGAGYPAADELGQAIQSLLEMFNLLTSPLAAFWPKGGRMQQLQKQPLLLKLPPVQRANQAIASLDATIQYMIDQRRASPGGDDLLALLLAAQDPDGSGDGMDDHQARDETLTLFLAGHETTANALTWAWYLLSQHPQVEAGLHAELYSALGGRLPEAADVERLPYTRMVLTEALRLYPPAWAIGREALQDYPMNGYVIPGGATVLMSQWVVHHDPRYFPSPWKFDPLRWSPGAQASLPRFAFFPFGGGPRLCIGEGFAWMESVLLLATLAQTWRMQLRPGHTVILQPTITLRPKGGMPMVLERR